ncbi:MAG TPA: nuclear transport factor 2 family protein [Actinocrinis sp.]|nr:nuclear transport factor 2 family protein [Actinocrinis sp.]
MTRETESVETVVLAAEAARLAAMTAADTSALAELLAPQCRYVHSTGASDDRDSYLAKLADGSLRYLTVEALDVQPVNLGSTVLVLHRMRAEALVDGTPRSLHSQIVAVWQVAETGPAEGGARLVYLQSTNLPSPS